MINKAAVELYLKKEVNSHLWIKKLSKKELIEILPKCEFKTKPYKHQLAGILAGLLNDGFLFFFDLGTGKSLISLYTLKLRREDWKRVLVLSPNASTVSTFSDEIKKHTDFTCVELMGTKEERWNMIDYHVKNNTEIFIINYTGLLVLLTDPVDGKWVQNNKNIKKFTDLFDTIIADEIHSLKNHRSLSFQVCRKLFSSAKIRFGLTGTPINRDPMALWSQFYLVDKGETLGETLSLYREAFFDAKDNFWGGVDYKFKHKLEPLLNKKLSNKSLRYAEWEANELPEKVVVDYAISMPQSTAEYYSQVVDGIIEAQGNLTMIKNSFHKLRQLCSGYVNVDDLHIPMKENPKLDSLVDLINSVDDKYKIVVFLDYVKSGDIVCERLKKEKIKFERLYGGTKDKVGAKNKFLDDNKCKVLVANTKSGGVGLNLQLASYMIFYELPVSSIDYAQAEKRIHRTGQVNRTFIYKMVVRGSIEEKLQKYLLEGKDLFNALVEGKEKWK